MSTTEERVVLTAELKDAASAPLSRLESKVDKAARTVDKASTKITRATSTASADTVRNMLNMGTSATRMQKMASGSMTQVGSAATRMSDQLRASGSAMGGMLGNLRANVDAYNALRASQGRSASVLSGFLSKVKAAPGMLLSFARNAVTGSSAYQVLSAGLRRAGQAAQGAFMTIGNGAKHVTGMVGSVLRGSTAFQLLSTGARRAKEGMNTMITKARQAPGALAGVMRSLRENSVGYQIMAYNGLRAAAAVARGAATMNKGFSIASTGVRRSMSVVGGAIGGGARAVRELVLNTVSAKSRIIESWKSPTAAVSSFTGKLGTVTGVTRTVTDMMVGSFRALTDKLGLTGFAGKVKGAFSGIGSGLSAAAPIAGKVASAVGTIAGAAGRAGSAISSQVNGALMETVSTATKAAGVIGAVLGGIAIQGGVSRALNIEDAQAKLTGLGHSAKSVQQIMDNASASVKGTAFGLGDAATVAAGAVAAGVKPGKDLERTLKLIGDGATIAGMSMGEMGSIWNKVASSDMIQGDVIAQLGDAGIPILQLLAKETGKSATEVKKMASDGQINFATFQKAMEEGMGGAALKSGETFRGAMANTRSALGRIGETFMTPFLTMIKAGFNTAIPIFDGFNAALKPLMAPLNAWAEKNGPLMIAWGQKVGAAIQTVVAVITGNDIPEAFKKAFSPEEQPRILAVMRRIGDGFLGLKTILSGGGFSQELANAFNINENSPIVGFLNTVAEHMDVVKQAIGPLAGLALAFFSKFAGGLPIIGQFLPVLNPIVGVVAGLLATSPQLREALFGMFEGLVPVVQTLFTALQPLLPVIMEALGSIGDALASVLPVVGEAMGQLLTAVIGLIPAIAPLIGLVAEFAGQLISMLIPILPPVIQFITMLVGIVAQLLPVLMPIIGAVLQLGLSILSALMPVLPILMDAFQKLLPPIMSLITSLLELMMAVITPLMPLITSIAGMLSNVLGGAVEGLTPIISFLIDCLTNLTNFMSAVLEPLISSVSGLFGGLADVIGTVVGGIGNFAGKVGTGIGNFFGGGAAGGAVVGGFAGGGVVQGFAGGGVIPGYAPGRDTVPAVLSRGEAVLVPELVKAIGPRNIMALNRAYSGRQSGGGPAAATTTQAMQLMPTLTASGGAVLSETPTLSSAGYESPLAESAPSNISYGGSTTIVKVAQGAVQINVHTKGERVDERDLEAIKEAVEEIFNDVERKGY